MFPCIYHRFLCYFVSRDHTVNHLMGHISHKTIMAGIIVILLICTTFFLIDQLGLREQNLIVTSADSGHLFCSGSSVCLYVTRLSIH